MERSKKLGILSCFFSISHLPAYILFSILYYFSSALIYSKTKEYSSFNLYAIGGLVTCCIVNAMTAIGLILGIIGVKQSNREVLNGSKSYKTLNVLGIVFSAFGIFLNAIEAFIYAALSLSISVSPPKL